MFFGFSDFLHFWRENDVTNFVPKFGFANMGYLMLLFERTFHKDLKTEKKSEISLSTQKISSLEFLISKTNQMTPTKRGQRKRILSIALKHLIRNRQHEELWAWKCSKDLKPKVRRKRGRKSIRADHCRKKNRVIRELKVQKNAASAKHQLDPLKSG